MFLCGCKIVITDQTLTFFYAGATIAYMRYYYYL